MSAHDDIAGLSDEALNREIAEAIGLVDSNGVPTHSGFARNFNRQFATPERGGFVGPVAWLDEQYERLRETSPIVAKAIIRAIYHLDPAGMAAVGSRHCANDLLRAIRAVKEAEDG